jgi:hypothetical protein
MPSTATLMPSMVVLDVTIAVWVPDARCWLRGRGGHGELAPVAEAVARAHRRMNRFKHQQGYP